MCTYVTTRAEVEGSVLIDGEWQPADRAVVYFDHPQDAKLAHALCIDVWAAGGRVAVELEGASARRLAESILATLDDDEVKVLLG
jgi:hypothetical protein